MKRNRTGWASVFKHSAASAKDAAFPGGLAELVLAKVVLVKLDWVRLGLAGFVSVLGIANKPWFRESDFSVYLCQYIVLSRGVNVLFLAGACRFLAKMGLGTSPFPLRRIESGCGGRFIAHPD